jgi:hypothetical protein
LNPSRITSLFFFFLLIKPFLTNFHHENKGCPPVQHSLETHYNLCVDETRTELWRWLSCTPNNFYDCSVHAVITAWGQLTTMLGVTYPILGGWMSSSNAVSQEPFLVHCITSGRCQSGPANSHFDSLCSQWPFPTAENGHWEQSEPKWLQLMVHMFSLTHC